MNKLHSKNKKICYNVAMIRIKHVNESDGIYIGRPTPLGNPFKIGVHGNRTECIYLYKKYIFAKIRDKDYIIINEMNRLYRIAKKQDLTLTCWCKDAKHPNRSCHGDVIKNILEYWNEKS